MSVNAVGGINMNAMSYAGALTPDALMSYCSARLKDIDNQVQTAFAKQNDYRAQSEATNALQEKLAALGASPNDGIHADDVSSRTAVEQLFQTALDACPNGSDAKDRLTTIYNGYEASMDPLRGGDYTLGKDEAASIATNLGQISKDISSSAELDMIGLQSLMSQRQTAIQMTTNLVQSLGQQLNMIAQKIGGGA